MVERVRVHVPDDMTALVTRYLSRRADDLVQLDAAQAAENTPPIASIAHRIRGNAASFGFTELSAIGVRLEAAALRHDLGASGAEIMAMRNYLDNVELYGPAFDTMSHTKSD